MKVKHYNRLPEPRALRVAKNHVVSIKGRRESTIRCIDGTVWVTWPPGEETTLQGGQTVAVATTDKICIQAMTAAVLSVQSTGGAMLSKLLRRVKGLPLRVIRPDRARRNI
jgi:hypothetical protein